MNECLDRWMNGYMYETRWMSVCVEMDRWLDEQICGWMDGYMNKRKGR